MSPLRSPSLASRTLRSPAAPRALAAAALLVAGLLLGPLALADGADETRPSTGLSTLTLRFDPDTVRADGGKAVSTLYAHNPLPVPVDVRLSLVFLTEGWTTSFRDHTVTLAPDGWHKVRVTLTAPADAPDRARGDLNVRAEASDGREAKAGLVAYAAHPPGPSLRLALDPEHQRVAAGDLAKYRVIVHNAGREPLSLLLRAHERTGSIDLSFDRDAVRLAPGEAAHAVLYAKTDARDANATYGILVHAVSEHDRNVSAHAKAGLAVFPPKRMEPCIAESGECPPRCDATVRCPPPPCCERSHKGHPTDSGYRLYIPLDRGAFDVPVRIRGHVDGQMLVIDLDFGPGDGPRIAHPDA